MTTIQEPVMTVDVRETAMRLAMSTEASQPWIVNWSGIWVGALAALATALILGLVATRWARMRSDRVPALINEAMCGWEP